MVFYVVWYKNGAGGGVNYPQLYIMFYACPRNKILTVIAMFSGEG